jgi:hypothetical protein
VDSLVEARASGPTLPALKTDEDIGHLLITDHNGVPTKKRPT